MRYINEIYTKFVLKVGADTLWYVERTVESPISQIGWKIEQF
jgi:hypothetical protein